MQSNDPSSADPHEEIAALVSQLSEIQQRLSVLTGGEVDAVLLPTGHSHLLGEAQEKLRESEAAQRRDAAIQSSILNALPAQIALLDERGVILSVNKAWQRFAGQAGSTPAPGVGQSYVEVCEQAQGEGSDDAHRVATGIRAVLAGQLQDFSHAYCCVAGGDRYWHRLQVNPLNRQGARGAVIMRTDITEQRRALEAIRIQAQMLDQIGQAVIATDAGGKVVYVNRAAVDLYGWTVPEVIGRDIVEITVPQNSKAQADEIMQQLQRGESWTGEFYVQNRTGRVFPVLVTDSPLLDQGRLVGVIGISQDISVRRQSEERIAEQAALIDQAHDAIIVCDLEGRITSWNKGAEQLYGWEAPAALGQSRQELLKPHTETFQVATITVRRDGMWKGVIQKTARNGAALTVDARWTLLRDTQGNPKSILTIDTDITEQRKLEQQFLRAQRMESLGTLAGGIAHDLNNLLSPITLGANLLRLQSPHSNNLAVIETIERSAKRGADLVKQVLSFARGVEGARVPVQIRHIARDVVSIVENTFPKNITVALNLPQELWLIVGDPTQLNQVLLNLCVNARDAMPQGGTLSLSARNVEIDAQYASMNRGVNPGRYVLTEVTDDGIGIPREIIDRIFEPFFTTKEPGEGTGLGLSTVVGIVRSHGGFVNVYSEPGKGSKFSVYLPAGSETGKTGTHAPMPESFPRGNGELILVVDDEISIREITKNTLETYGYRVICAEDGARAVGLYAQHREQIKVVLTDMMMPVMDGPALIGALQHMDSNVRIIAASGLQADVASGNNSGVSHFIPKPYSAVTLLTKIRVILTESAAPQDR